PSRARGRDIGGRTDRMSDAELEFDAEELAMLRQLFKSEAHSALEGMTARVLAGGSARPTREALTERTRVTHTRTGAPGAVGLPAMVDLSHRLESALAALGRDPSLWTAGTADSLVAVVDALRSYLDQQHDPQADAAADELRLTIDEIARPPGRSD